MSCMSHVATFMYISLLSCKVLIYLLFAEKLANSVCNTVYL